MTETRCSESRDHGGYRPAPPEFCEEFGLRKTGPAGNTRRERHYRLGEWYRLQQISRTNGRDTPGGSNSSNCRRKGHAVSHASSGHGANRRGCRNTPRQNCVGAERRSGGDNGQSIQRHHAIIELDGVGEAAGKFITVGDTQERRLVFCGDFKQQ